MSRPVVDLRPDWPRLLTAGLILAAVAGCWRLGTAWYEGTTIAHDFIQDYAMIKGVLARDNPYLPHNDVMLEVFGPPRYRPKLWPGHWPSSLPFLLPIAPGVAAGSHTIAFLTWGVINLAAFLALCAVTLHALGVERPILLGCLSGMALMVLPPIWENFAEGQLNPLVALGVAATWALRRNGHPVLAGVCLGLAFGLKPVPGLLFLYYVWRRDRRLLVAAGAVLVGLNLAALALAGVEGVRHYFTVNYPSHAIFWTGYPDNASLTGFVARLFGPIPYDWPKPLYPVPGVTPVLAAVCTVLLAALVWLLNRGRQRPPAVPDLEFVACSVLTLLVAPYIWPHYYIFLVAPAGIIVRSLIPGDNVWDRNRILALGMLAVSVCVMSNAHWTEPPRGVGTLQLAALLVLYAVCLLVLRMNRGRRELPRRPDTFAGIAEPA
jgi:hypothetical protein